MKAIMLIVVSVFILNGCKNILEWIWEGDPNIKFAPIEEEIYWAYIQVKFENGNPCTWAVTQDGKFKADENGRMQISSYYHLNDGENREALADTITQELRIYNHPWGDLMVWKGDIKLIRYVEGRPWPPKNFVITIPDQYAKSVP